MPHGVCAWVRLAAGKPMIEFLAIFQKDLRSECRTRYALNGLLLFALATMAALSFASGGIGLTPMWAAVFVWIITMFSALSSLAHAFVKESETKTETFLKLTASADAVFFGKWAFNMVLVIGLQVILSLLSPLLLGLTVDDWIVWSVTMALGGVGLVSIVTLLGAVVAAANVRGALFSVLALPLLLPLLIVAIRATEFALGGDPGSSVGDSMIVLGAYAVVTTTAGWLLFPFVWRG